MKAVILAAGVGSRIRPLTDNKHKSLLAVAGQTILGRMLTNVVRSGITEVIFVTGYRADDIKNFVKDNFSDLNSTFIHNEKYEITNTGYSLLLTKDAVGESDFVKFDADVVFESSVLEKLLHDEHPNCLCVDTNIHLDKEEVKTILGQDNAVQEVGKKLDPKKSNGESIGIERISKEAGKVFFAELERLMKDQSNYQQYYDDTYTTLVTKGIPFHAVNITDYKWVEIDTLEDYEKANKLFS